MDASSQLFIHHYDVRRVGATLHFSAQHIVYPSRQNAYVARDRLQVSGTFRDSKVTIRVELKDVEAVVRHIEKLRGVEPLVCLSYGLSYGQDAFKRGEWPLVDVVFRYMCRPPDFTILGPDRWRHSFSRNCDTLHSGISPFLL